VGFITYPVRKAYAPCYIVICGLSGSTICFHATSSAARFLEKKVIAHKLSALIFSTTSVLNISLSEKNEEKRYEKMYLGIHVKYSLFLPDFQQT
jgi:hypothetical protein